MTDPLKFTDLTDEQQLEAIQFMSRSDAFELSQYKLLKPVREKLLETIYSDLECHGEQYRFHISHDHIVIKRRTYGKDGNSYGGWSFHEKFPINEAEQAEEAWIELCRRADDPKPVEVVEGEMVPTETPNFDQVEVSTTVETSITKAVSLIEFSKKFAQISVICAAQAGAEFAQIKEQCERGEWMKVLKILPFGKDTVYKYIKIADELQQRLSEGGDAFDLLQLPDPQELVSGDHSDIIDQINAVTGEQTLRQLYFDWGILKKPSSAGGDRKPGKEPTSRELEEVRRQDANESIGSLCTDLQNTCINEKRCLHRADIKFLKLLEGDLIDALHNVKTLINAG